MPPDNEVLERVAKEVNELSSKGIPALRDSLMKDLTEVRGQVDRLGKDLAKAGPETTQQIDTFKTLIGEKYAAIEKQVDEIKKTALDAAAAIQRFGAGGEPGGDAKEQMAQKKRVIEYHRTRILRAGSVDPVAVIPEPSADQLKHYISWEGQFSHYLRRDKDRIEQFALMVGSDPNGGYLVPIQTSSRIIEKVYETSPIRQVASVENVGTDALNYPVDTGEADAGWVGETQSPPTTNTPTVETGRIPVHELYAKPKASQQILEDAAIDIEAWLARKVADKFARVEAAAFVNGDGINKPRGLLTYPAGTTAFPRGRVLRIASGHATQITADALINMTFALKGPYLTNASWLMARGSIGAIALLKGGDGQYLWRPGLSGDMRAQILGYPMRQADDFPAVGAGTLPVAFGDFRQAYTIVERLGITTLRDPYVAKPFVEFYTRRRVGGDVVNFEAYVLMVVSAS